MKPQSTDQDELQRMLALKRREQPPLKFFKGLSSAVIDRIQHPEPPPPPTVWQRLGMDFDSRPVLVCVSGAAVCGLLAYALVSSRHVKEPPAIPRADSAVSPLPGHSSPGQIDSTPPVRAPGSTPEDVPRSGEPVRVNPASRDPMVMRPWPAPPSQGAK